MNDQVVQIAHPRLHSDLVMEVPPDPGDFLLLFTDGSESRAAVVADETGRPTLKAGAYMTPDGGVVDACVWSVRETVRQGERVTLRLGRPLT
ncbi:hypothetical protein [Nonomuraea cavernae]|uniref:hypothetical protein n=1 Tax=Nonomuraea cavernae TaxID=2045107 RepID=UPI0033E822A7